MKQKIILNSIIDEIYQLENYIQGWRDNEAVPAIEKDLVQRKLQEIYDQVKHLNETIQTEQPKTPAFHEIITVTKEPEITVPGPITELVFETNTQMVEETKSIIQEIPVKKEPVQQFVEVPVSKTEIELENTKQPTKEISTEKVTTHHKFINETVKTRTVMDVSSKLKSSPISSIQSAINLNDKFLIIRELFKNNNLLYNQTMERLNNAQNYEDAVSIIEKEFAWNMKEPLVIKLIELIKRKHNA